MPRAPFPGTKSARAIDYEFLLFAVAKRSPSPSSSTTILPRPRYGRHWYVRAHSKPTRSQVLLCYCHMRSDVFLLSVPTAFLPLDWILAAGPRLALMASAAGLGAVGAAYMADKVAASVLGQTVIF